MRHVVLKLLLAAALGTTGALAGVGYAASDRPCDNPGCKTTTETVKEAGQSGGFTQENTQQNASTNNPNKQTEG